MKESEDGEPAQHLTPVPTPFSSAWNAPLRLELAPALACWACPALTPASWSALWSLAAALLSVLSSSADWPATAAEHQHGERPADRDDREEHDRGARPRAAAGRCSAGATSGESTAATIAAVTTGATIALVSDSSTATPTSSAATPTSSHDIIPRSRSHAGAAKTPLQLARRELDELGGGSPLGLPDGRWRMTRRGRIVLR